MLRRSLARMLGACILLAASAVAAQADPVTLTANVPFGVVLPSGTTQSFFGVLTNNTQGTIQLTLGTFAYSGEASTSVPNQFFTVTDNFSPVTLLPGQSLVVPLFTVSVAPGLTEGYIRGPFIVYATDPASASFIRLGESQHILINLNREVFSSVPEPATLLLFGTGLAAATRYARRRGRRG